MRRVTRRRRITRIVRTALLVLVGAIAVTTTVIPFVLGAQAFTVLTGSMRPTLEPGALIVVKQRDIGDVRAGDIVTFQMESGKATLATHRVVGVSENTSHERLLTTRGDANEVNDQKPVREVQLRGVVLYSIPLVGYVNVWATPGTKSLLVVAVGALIIGYGVIALLRDSSRRRRAKRTATAGVIVAIAVISGLALSPLSSQAASEEPLLISVNGSSWSADDITLSFGERVLVPGDRIERTIRFLNSSKDDAQLGIQRVKLINSHLHAPFSLYANGKEITAKGRDLGVLRAGAEHTVKLTLAFEPSEGHRGHREQILLTATLTQKAPPGGAPVAPGVPDAEQLPITGSRPAWTALLLAFSSVVVGIMLHRRKVDSRSYGTE